MRIFGVSGNGSGAGKTYFSKKVADQVYSIAGSLRAELQKLYPEYDWYRRDQEYKDTKIVHEWGRDVTVRDVLTAYGQKRCEEEGDTYWIDKLVDHLKQAAKIADGVSTIAIDDIRKLCELNALKEAFPGQVIHVHVVGVGAKEEKHFDNDDLGGCSDYWCEW